MGKLAANDFEIMMGVYMKVFGDDPKYFINPTIYEIDIFDGIPRIKKTKNLLNAKYTEQALLKLVHNIAMIDYFSSTYDANNNILINDDNCLNDHKYNITLQILSENIDIIDSKGFDINEDDEIFFDKMSLAIKKIREALIEYIDDLSNNNDEYSDLSIIVDYANNNYINNVDESLVCFIKEYISEFDAYLE